MSCLVGEPIVFDYRIEDSEWRKSARLLRDPHAEPLYEAFYGHVTARHRDQDLLGRDGFYMSVADLAVQPDEFLDRVASFVHGFAVDAEAHVPGALSWRELSQMASVAAVLGGDRLDGTR